jgi:hypothetical protein
MCRTLVASGIALSVLLAALSLWAIAEDNVRRAPAAAIAPGPPPAACAAPEEVDFTPQDGDLAPMRTR